MDPELRDLLRTVANDTNGDSFTHVTLYGSYQQWTIKPHNLTSFWVNFCDLVDRKNNGRGIVAAEPYADLCLAERPQDVMPVIAKLQFKFQKENAKDTDWEPFSDEFLHHICHTYQSVLEEYFRIIPGQPTLVTVVLESATHWEEEDIETGQCFLLMDVKIQFPYARVDASLQNRMIRPRVIQLLRNSNAMSKLQRQPIGDWDKIIAQNSIDLPVPMYGNTEVHGRPKLELTHIWAQITNDMLEDGTPPEEVGIEDAFIPTNHQHVQQQAVSGDIFTANPDMEHWLPMLLSIGYWPTVLLPREELQDDGRFAIQKRMLEGGATPQRIFGGGKKGREEIDSNKVELAERMIPMIGSSRFLREAFWLDVGKALYNANEGSENGLLSWINHTEKALIGINKTPDYMLVAGTIAETCRDIYNTFSNSYITIKTLAWYAREDSPDRYASWHKDWCLSSMELALGASHTDVTIALWKVYWLDFSYCPLGKGKWFQFKNHRWIEVNQGIALRKAISSDFMKKFEAFRVLLSRQIHDTNDDTTKANGEITMKKLTALIGKLKTVGFKSSLMTEAQEHFSDDRFSSLLDSNSDLLGVTNGVLEVVGDTVQFRLAKPEDYISMCTGVPYHVSYNWQHPLVQKCMKWIGQVFTDRQLQHHFLKFAASCLKGGNNDKIFPIWTGSGDNSKSMIVKLFESVFGPYCIKFPVSMLSEKAMNSSGPTPQLARAKATRVAFLDEPEDDIPMHKGTIKRYTGGDSFFARLLQDNGGDIKATFKMILMCNKVPIIPNADQAIKNRTRLFPFMSKWVHDPPKDEEEQYRQRLFKIDGFFDRQIPVMAPAFLWIMTQYFPYYTAEKLPDPPIVTETTEAYWRDNDVYAQFAADNIQEMFTETGERDASSRVTLTEIYNEFKIWFRDAFPQTKVPERTIVKSELSSRWGRMHGNTWHGIRIVSDGSGMDATTALGGKPAVKSQPTQEMKKPIPQPSPQTVIHKTAPEILAPAGTIAF